MQRESVEISRHRLAQTEHQFPLFLGCKLHKMAIVIRNSRTLRTGFLNDVRFDRIIIV